MDERRLGVGPYLKVGEKRERHQLEELDERGECVFDGEDKIRKLGEGRWRWGWFLFIVFLNGSNSSIDENTDKDSTEKKPKKKAENEEKERKE